jgi:hypothetical protein
MLNNDCQHWPDHSSTQWDGVFLLGYYDLTHWHTPGMLGTQELNLLMVIFTIGWVVRPEFTGPMAWKWAAPMLCSCVSPVIYYGYIATCMFNSSIQIYRFRHIFRNKSYMDFDWFSYSNIKLRLPNKFWSDIYVFCCTYFITISLIWH